MAQTPAQPPSPAQISVKPAATVVIFRHSRTGHPPELLLVQRARNMRFAGGAAVFPGGRIDEADRTLAAGLALNDASACDAEDAAARIAAIRETLEETGLAIGIARPVSGNEAAQARAMLLSQGALAPVLAQMGWQLKPEVLVPFARWCPMYEGSFDTRFYLADLGTGAVDITVDLTENTHLFWATAADALAMADRAAISLVFPTRRNLERLALFGSFAEARAQVQSHPVRMIVPAVVEEAGRRWLTIPEDCGYPVTRELLDSAVRG